MNAKFELEYTMDEAAFERAPFFSKDRGATEYLYFLREWWPAGHDVVAYWREASGTCRRFAAAKGEQTEETREFEVLHDDVLDPATWEDIKAFAVGRGILDVDGPQPSLTTRALRGSCRKRASAAPRHQRTRRSTNLNHRSARAACCGGWSAIQTRHHGALRITSVLRQPEVGPSGKLATNSRR